MATSSLFRRLRRVILAMGIMAASMGSAAGTAPVVAVVGVEANRVADIVLLNAGFDAGLRQGMLCRVTRQANEVAEVLLVDLRPGCSAALIVDLAPQQIIRPGDLVQVKVLKS